MALVGGIAFVIPNGEREEGILEKERALKDIAGTKRDVEEAPPPSLYLHYPYLQGHSEEKTM